MESLKLIGVLVGMVVACFAVVIMAPVCIVTFMQDGATMEFWVTGTIGLLGAGTVIGAFISEEC